MRTHLVLAGTPWSKRLGFVIWLGSDLPHLAVTFLQRIFKVLQTVSKWLGIMNFKTLLQHYCIYGIVHNLLNIHPSFDCYFWNWIWYVSQPILPGLFILLCTANVNWPITSRGCHCSIRLLLSRCLQWKITKSRNSNLYWANVSTSRHSIYN